jgi:hypothetical protein
MATVTVTVEKIGIEDMSLGSGTWNRTTSIGGTQAMTKVSVPTIEAGISDVSAADMIKLHAITETAAHIDTAALFCTGASATAKPLAGDTTAGRVIRVIRIHIYYRLNSWNYAIANVWNAAGDAKAETEGTGNSSITIATTGNAIAVLACNITERGIDSAHEAKQIFVSPTIVANDIVLTFTDESKDEVDFEHIITSAVGQGIYLDVTYVTSV